jgi:hypothetical protein
MKTKLSPLYDGLRGKIGSIVASYGRGGAYVRARVIPFNAKSTDQVAARSRLTSFSQAWAALDEADRILWNGAVDSWKGTDVFGEKTTPSGFNLYCALNCNIDIVSGVAIDVPPAVVAVPALTTLSVAVVAATSVILTFLPDPFTTGSRLIAMATPPMSPGRMAAFSDYRIVAIGDNVEQSPWDIITEYTAKFGGTGLAGTKIFFKCYGIHYLSGKKGAPLTADCIVT